MLVVLYYQYLILDNLEMFFMFVVNVMFVDINSILCLQEFDGFHDFVIGDHGGIIAAVPMHRRADKVW